MRVLTVVVFLTIWVAFAIAQQPVQLFINFLPGASATRILTCKVTGEWVGPTHQSPDKPVSVPFEVSVQASFYLVVSRITPEGDGVLSLNLQGLKVNGKAADKTFESTVSYDGVIQASCNGFKFDSTQLPEEKQANLRKLLTDPYEVTLSPLGEIKSVSLPEAIKEFASNFDLRFLSQCFQATLITLLPAPFPTEPINIGDNWSINLPLPISGESGAILLPMTCSLKELKDNEAVIFVETDQQGETNIALKSLCPKFPQTVIKGGQLQVNGEVIFLVGLNVPQRAKWTVQAEGKFEVTSIGINASPIPCSLRFNAELEDRLLF